MSRFNYIIGVCLSVWVMQMDAQLGIALQELMDVEDLHNTQLAIHVRSLDGKTIYDHNGSIAMMPASTMKVITTFAVLGALGEEYRFVTTIGYRGELMRDGTLYGDLIIRGSGDPSLGSGRDRQASGISDVLNQIIASIDNVITCVEGDILVDAAICDDEAIHPGWMWDDLCNYYATGVWGLNLHENLYYLALDRSNEIGRPVGVGSITPEAMGLHIVSKVTTAEKNSGDQAYIYGDPYGLHKIVRGTIPVGSGRFVIKGAIPDSRVWFGDLLRFRLAVRGIRVGYVKVKDVEKVNIIPLLKIVSPMLKDLVFHANVTSNNLYCDAFFKLMGARYFDQGTWRSGQKAMMTYLNQEGIGTNGYHQEDGSGLSMRNRVSPAFMTAFIARHIDKWGVDEVLSLLPKAGIDGSLKYFLKGQKVQSHAWLKSGSIDAVVAYTGILEITQGEYVLLSIVANGHQKPNTLIRNHIAGMIEMVYQILKTQQSRQ